MMMCRKILDEMLFKFQLVAASNTGQRLSLLPDRSCNEIQLVLQLVDLENSSHTYSTHHEPQRVLLPEPIS